MKRILSVTLFVLMITAVASLDPAPLVAQTKRISPHETVSAVLEKGNQNSRVTVTYGRPYSKDSKTGQVRKIWGTLVPYGKVWRVGADEATTLITQQPLKVGDASVAAGAYTLFLLPAESGPTKLIINKQLGQWGLTYEEKQDLARVDMKKEALDPPVDQFTMAIDRNPAGGGVLKMMWEATQFSVPLAVQK